MARVNDEVARRLDELARLTEIAEGSPQAFRVRAYDNAARAVRGLSRDVSELSASELAAVKGIGRSIAGKIREHVDTGRIAKLEELRGTHPPGQLELLRIPGLGPKSVALLAERLGVVDLDGLVAALDDGSVADLPGMGERTAAQLRTAIDRLGLTSKQQRVPLALALPIAERLIAALREVDGVVDAAYAGSARRFVETVGDLDVLVAAREPEAVTARFVALDDVAEVTGSGSTKTSVLTHDGLQVDLRVVAPESLGAALLYFTGSKAHNIRLRQRAIARGWTLSEYALAVAPPPADEEDAQAPPDGESPAAEPADGEASEAPQARSAGEARPATATPQAAPGEVVAQRTEEEIYAALGLAWIWPEQREDVGEIEAAEAGGADLLTADALVGDLHVHTDRSGDGHDSLEAMVAAAVERGRQVLAITDHAENLAINGISREEMLAQRAELRELEQARGDIRLLHGVELNIGPDGGLDYDDAFLAGFDWCVASIHSHLGRPAAEQTARLIAAIRHPAVHVIGHPTARMLGKRPGVELDAEAVLDAAAETGTAIEINASLSRLDAPAEMIRAGRERGVVFTISSDAHRVADLDRLPHGARQARRGGLSAEHVASAWEPSRFEAWRSGLRDG